MSERGIIKGYIQASFDPLSTDVPIYQGEYEFSASTSQQTIPTKGKALENDIIINANPYDSNTTDATATASEILNAKTAYVNKQKITGTMQNNGAVNQKLNSISETYIIPEGYHNGEGTVSISSSSVSTENIKSGTEVLGIQGEMPNRGAVKGEISTVSESYSIPNGYHDGEGTVQIKNSERTKIIPSNIKSGIEILGVAGSFTSDANATTSQLLDGQTAYVNGSKITGSMVNRGVVNSVISNVEDSFTIQEGYHSGLGSVSISSTEQEKIIPENIKSGIEILGITGSHIGGIDTSDATATTSEILSGKTAYIQNGKVTGEMVNHRAVIGNISNVSEIINIEQGYHNGEGTVQIKNSERTKIIPSNIKSGIEILGVTGSYTSDANAVASQILSGQTAYVNGSKITGSMINREAVNGEISTKADSFIIEQGYHNGSGQVKISETEQAKIIPQNIRAGIKILGFTGTNVGCADTSYATANASEILINKTAYLANGKTTGTMTNCGAINGTISTIVGAYSIPEGYHNGSGTVSISNSEKAKIVPENIKNGVSILGVTGNLSATASEGLKEITPYKFDYHDGYFSGSVWRYYSTDYKYCSDIYQVQKDKIYFITLGNAVGSQFLSGFVTNDVSANHANSVAEIINDSGGGQRFSNFMFMPEQNGYLIILKDETFVTGIKTYLYDVTNTWI
ncbi:MAG: hypothetical protein IJP96_10100 [Synergistaceae bacterium]|nr:hypothetical protein [Synergistaceae bacterium]